MRHFITGITGFVGSHLAKRLVDQENEVYGLMRRRADGAPPKRLVEMGILDQVRLVEGDITDLTSLLFAVEKVDPDVIFHLAAQTYVPRSFVNPVETFRTNSLGTQNLLEAVRLKEVNPRIVFAGSSEEYGLQIAHDTHYNIVKADCGHIFPEPERIPEVPINEKNPLRPRSPYAVSKIYGDYLMRNYHSVYGMRTVVSRGFNHEGAGRGDNFVTSVIVRQCIKLKMGEQPAIVIGNVNAFRDWSHIDDIVDGYILLSEKGRFGDVYVQGSMRTNSVLTYILMTLKHLGYEIGNLEILSDLPLPIKYEAMAETSNDGLLGVKFERTKADLLMFGGRLEFTPADGELRLKTNKGDIPIIFDPTRFRPAEVPVLFSDTSKIQKLGFKTEHSLGDIIRDQTNYYLNPTNR